MFAYCSPHDLTQPNRHGIPNHPANRLEATARSRFHELISLREGLENRSLAEGDGAVLLGVAEASIAEAEELRGDGGRRFVRLHAAIDAGVGLAGFLFVTLRDEAGWPVAPSAAGSRVADAPEVLG